MPPGARGRGSGSRDRTRPPLPLEALHADGSVSRAVAIGSGAAAKLMNAAEPAGEGLIDLLLIAPSAAERRSREWAEEAARHASKLAPDGLVVTAGPGRSIRKPLNDLGLRPRMRLLHAPDVARSRHVLPLRGPAARYAVEAVLPLGRVKRAAARAVVRTGLAPRGTTSVILQRPGARPPLQWLWAFDGSRAGRDAIISRSWRAGGSTVLQRFTGSGRPDAIAKIGGGAEREATALAALGPAAREAGALVPDQLGRGEVGGRPVLFETPMPGAPAAMLLARAPDRLPGLLRDLSRWLADWNSASAAPRPFTAQQADRLLLAPARRLAESHGEARGLHGSLEELCRRCLGAPIPLVAAHNDLTAANVVVGRDGSLAIVDWEEAEAEALPLGDLAYAIVDLVAAVDGYEDRAAAYAACFRPPGRWGETTSELIGAAAASLGLEPPVTDLCLTACWLAHADDELAEAGPGAPATRPFLEILRLAVPPARGEAAA